MGRMQFKVEPVELFIQEIQRFLCHRLVEELESVDWEKTPWLVIMMHAQSYTTCKAHNDEEGRLSEESN